MKPSFKSPEAEDKTWIEKTLKNTVSSEAAFGTHFIWSEAFGVKVCNYEGIFIKKSEKSSLSYEFPRGAESEDAFKSAVKFIFDDCKKANAKELKFTELVNSEAFELDRIFPKKFEFISRRDKFEYVYYSQDLASLKGKKYHSKKNHISKFSKNHDWRYVEINPKNKDKYLNFFKKWFTLKCRKKNYCDIPEYRAIQKAIENYEFLNLSGGTIEINGKIVACTLGEEINDKIFLIHFEKALPEYNEAYSVINNEFAKFLSKKYEFINREEDMGIPGLRKSKLSYKPAFLVPKYEAVLKDFENGIF